MYTQQLTLVSDRVSQFIGGYFVVRQILYEYIPCSQRGLDFVDMAF